jgi:hypothetical protein
LAQTNPSPSPFSKDFVGIRIKVESDLHFNGSEFSGKIYIRDAHFSNAALLDNCTFHDFVQMIGTTAGYKIRMNWCTFHAYIDLGETDDTTFELALSQISKADNALYSCPPKGWYIKEDVPGDFAILDRPRWTSWTNT